MCRTGEIFRRGSGVALAHELAPDGIAQGRIGEDGDNLKKRNSAEKSG